MSDESFLKMVETNFPDLYAEGRKADGELDEILSRLSRIAKEIIESKGHVKPPDIAAKTAADEQACIRSATVWIKSTYTINETLANEYGKTCMGDEQAKQQHALVSWAAALAEPQIAAKLREATQAIARAGVSMILQVFFMMGGPQDRKNVEIATENMKNAVAAARTVVMGL